MHIPKELFYFWKKRHRAVGRGLGIKRALHVYQNSHTYIPKEPYICIKKALHMHSPKELFYFWKKRHRAVGRGLGIKRALHVYRKSHTYTPKEPYIYTKRAIHIYQKSLTHALRKPYICIYQQSFSIFGKRDIELSAEDLGSKEPYIYTKRAILMYQKSPIYSPKEPYTCSKKALQMYVPKELLYSWKKRHHAVGRRTWYQKSPTYLPKETYIYTKRATCYAVRKPYVCVYQMRFFFLEKKTSYCRQRSGLNEAIHIYQKSHKCIPKESNTYKKRALCKHTKRVLYIYTKRALHIQKKSPA